MYDGTLFANWVENQQLYFYLLSIFLGACFGNLTAVAVMYTVGKLPVATLCNVDTRHTDTKKIPLSKMKRKTRHHSNWQRRRGFPEIFFAVTSPAREVTIYGHIPVR